MCWSRPSESDSLQPVRHRLPRAEQQIVVAAELTQDANDVQQLHPMLQAVY
jgi:hypothetical protein